jgi:hypothetical protein
VAQQGGGVTETGEKVKGVGCLPLSVDIRFRQRLKWNQEASSSIEVSSKEGFESRWLLFCGFAAKKCAASVSRGFLQASNHACHFVL